MEIIKINDIRKIGEIIPKKNFSGNSEISKSVASIIREVSEKGMKACIEFTKKFDHLELPEKEILLHMRNQKQVKIPDTDFKKAIAKAIENITAFHKKQKTNNYQLKTGKDSYAGEKWVPLDSVGCYVPGGSAPLISTIMMTVIPAKIAGVKKITVCTPPSVNGKINPFIFYVCKLLEVDEVLLLGGAQGIAAMALGLPGISEPVQKIVGPGNSFVTEAKRQLYGMVDIDMLAGPSEICILADQSAKASYIAADILSQIEHDKEAYGAVVSDSESLLKEIKEQLYCQYTQQERQHILNTSFKNIKLILTDSIEKGALIVDHIAPEHLEVILKKDRKFETYPFKAGAVFLGNFSPVPLGDFYGGTNHVLPTNGRAAFSSPLSVYDFHRRINYIKYSEKKFLNEAKYIETLARIEQLPAHRNSITIRSGKDRTKKPRLNKRQKR